MKGRRTLCFVPGEGYGRREGLELAPVWRELAEAGLGLQAVGAETQDRGWLEEAGIAAGPLEGPCPGGFLAGPGGGSSPGCGMLLAARDAAPETLAQADAVLAARGGWRAVEEAGRILLDGGSDVWPVRNGEPVRVFGGVNVLESLELALRTAETLAGITGRLGMRMVFKASFDKANRSSHTSYRGPGMEEGLGWLERVRRETGLPVMTDIHEPWQAGPVAEVADILQIPAFLCRQTDLLAAACRTGRPLHVKKMQMMSPAEAESIVEKCRALGNGKIILCERGTLMGYNNLVVDPLSFPQLKALGVPVSFDVTHALQTPGSRGVSTGGRGWATEPLALAGASQGIAALFLETHPDPSKALCDGPCALPLSEAERVLGRVRDLDRLVKGWN